MAQAILLGATSGALHAVTGPDHLLSLGPAALRRAKDSFRVGLIWGLGHGGGTLLLAAMLWLASTAVDLSWVSRFSERAAGAVLLVSGLLAFRRTRPLELSAPARSSGAPLQVGFLHGATGASALLLLTPALSSPELGRRFGYLLAFAIGSTLAMALLTFALGALSARLPLRAALPKIERLMALLSLVVGGTWLCLGAVL